MQILRPFVHCNFRVCVVQYGYSKEREVIQMENTTMYKSLIERYNRISYTHNYIFGFDFQGVIYAVTTTAKNLPFVCVLDKASRGCGYALRFKPTKAQKTYLLSLGADAVCSVDYFNSVVAESKYNRGEIFEKMVTEKCGQVWVKDNVPFTKAGDIEVNGKAFQIKFTKATFCNERSLEKLGG